MITSGTRHPSCSASSKPIVFFPSMRYGSRRVDAAYHPERSQQRLTPAPAAALEPPIRQTPPPYAAGSPTITPGTAFSRPHRQELAVSQHRPGPLVQRLAAHGIACAHQVVPDEQWTAVVLADLRELFEREVFSASRALEMGREAAHAARSIFAPSARRR